MEWTTGQWRQNKWILIDAKKLLNIQEWNEIEATFTFWGDKSSSKMPKKLNLTSFWKAFKVCGRSWVIFKHWCSSKSILSFEFPTFFLTIPVRYFSDWDSAAAGASANLIFAGLYLHHAAEQVIRLDSLEKRAVKKKNAIECLNSCIIEILWLAICWSHLQLWLSCSLGNGEEEGAFEAMKRLTLYSLL